MRSTASGHGIRIFSTCPPSRLARPEAYVRQVQETARWSEDAGCEGILVYTDSALLDPWLVSQVVVEATERLCPVVAIQPVYMHPYSVAKMVTSIGFLHGRRVCLNMLAGGFPNDLAALNDTAPHDERYARLEEYATIIQRLLRAVDPISFVGRYYQIANLQLTPPLPADLLPDVLISGSSEAGMRAARQLKATAVEYPKPACEYAEDLPAGVQSRGIRLGIIARGKDSQAWSIARTRFPEGRPAQLANLVAAGTADPSGRRPLSAPQPGRSARPRRPTPFQTYNTPCPYLVGSYNRVAEEVARYLHVGYRTFVLDVPGSPDEMRHVGIVFERAALSCAA